MEVSKQVVQTLNVQRINLRKLNEMEVTKQYQTEISNRFAAVENLRDREYTKYIKENIKTSSKETLSMNKLKQHKPWFDEECLFVFLLAQRKQAKMQWLQDPNHSKLYNPDYVRNEASRHYRNKKKEYMKAKTDDLETNSKITYIRELYRGINDFKKGYQPRT